MLIADLIYSQFLELNARLTMTEAIAHLRGTRVSHVVITGACFYLVPRDRLLEDLVCREGTLTLQHVLEASERQATPVFDCYEEAVDPPPALIAVDGGLIVGFYDITLPPKTNPLRDIPAGRPAVRTRFPDRCVVGRTHQLILELGRFMDGVALTGAALPKGARIDFLVHAWRGLRLAGSNLGSLKFDQEPIPTLSFDIEAIKVGTARIWVMAYFQGRRLMKTTLSINVQENIRDQPHAERVRLLALAPNTARDPDLIMTILEEDNGFRAILKSTSSSMMMPFGPFPLVNSENWFHERYREIGALPWHRDEGKYTQEKLCQYGDHFFQCLFPEPMRTTFLSLCDRIQGIHIQGQRHDLPWEFCRFPGMAGQAPFFLAQRFEMSRWPFEIKEQQRFRANHIGLVFPFDLLPNAANTPRRQALCTQLQQNKHRVSAFSADYHRVTEAMKQEPVDFWYFGNHNQSPEPSRNQEGRLLFAEGKDLGPTDFQGDLATRTCKNHPFIFMNCCYSSRPVRGVNGYEVSWPLSFLKAGASGFIGTFWPIPEIRALQFARIFFDYLSVLPGAAPPPIGQVMLQARKDMMAVDPTWAAYSLFANPFAALESR